MRPMLLVKAAEAINATLTTQGLTMPNSRRVWALHSEVLEQFPVPTRWLDRAVAVGSIRTVKFGTQKQSPPNSVLHFLTLARPWAIKSRVRVIW